MADPRFFDNHGPFTLRQLAERTGAELLRGQPDQPLEDVAALHQAGSRQLSFLDNRKYLAAFMESKAGAAFVHPSLAEKAPPSMAVLTSTQPYLAYAKAAALFYPDAMTPPAFHPGEQSGWPVCESASIGMECRIAPGTVIGPHARIGNRVTIGPGCIIGRGVEIGDGCFIAAGSVITHAVLGERVLLHPHAQIGQDGFGIAPAAGGHHKVPQLGRVMIGHDVEIGANSCIDRGAAPDTMIGEGTKIDNLVQVGHNVRIGRHCLIAAQTAFAGSCSIGDYVVIGGQVAIAGHLTVGDGVQIAGQSGVVADVPAGSVIGGTPAVPVRQWHRQSVALARLVSGKSKA